MRQSKHLIRSVFMIAFFRDMLYNFTCSQTDIGFLRIHFPGVAQLLSGCCRSLLLLTATWCREAAVGLSSGDANCIFPGVAQLVGRLVWELEHQNGSTSRNVVYSPFTSQLPPITSVESWAKLWYNFSDHIFDHNELFLLIQYPGVAQLIERAVWDREAAGSNPVIPTKIDKIRQSLVDFTYYLFTIP